MNSDFWRKKNIFSAFPRNLNYFETWFVVWIWKKKIFILNWVPILRSHARTNFRCSENSEQDGRLAPAYFSPNYKYFDQLLQTVKNKTTVLNLVSKEFLQISITPLISVVYAKEYHDFPLKNFCLTVPKNFVEEPFCVSENFWYRKMLGMRDERESRFSVDYFLSHSAENFVKEPFSNLLISGIEKC